LVDAVGVSSLPDNINVEIEAIFEVSRVHSQFAGHLRMGVAQLETLSASNQGFSFAGIRFIHRLSSGGSTVEPVPKRIEPIPVP